MTRRTWAVVAAWVLATTCLEAKDQRQWAEGKIVRAESPNRPPTSAGLGIEIWNPWYQHEYAIEGDSVRIEAFELVRTHRQFRHPPLHFSRGQTVRYAIEQTPPPAGATLYVIDAAGKEHVLSIVKVIPARNE